MTEQGYTLLLSKRTRPQDMDPLLEMRRDGIVPFEMPLSGFDLIMINTSAGKDSQAMTHMVCHEAKRAGVLDRVRMVHADLGEAEWEGCADLAAEHAKANGVPLIVTRAQQLVGHYRKKPIGLLEMVLRRRLMLDKKGKRDAPAWPSSTVRYCTSDLKRGPVRREINELTPRWPDKVLDCKKHVHYRVLNCLGMRADESPARSKLKPYSMNPCSNGVREVWDWLPIHKLTVKQVWDINKNLSGLRHHWAYDVGMPRLSCVFCIFANRTALLTAGFYNRALLHKYVDTERTVRSSFKVDLKLADIEQELEDGWQPSGKVPDFLM